MRKAILATAVMGLAALPLAVAAPANAAGHEAQVSILHGVPGLDVDVYVDDTKLLTDFKPGTLTDPQPLAEGTYDLRVFATGDDPATDDPAIEADGVSVPGGANITVVAHLDADGTPVLTPFVNDVSRVAPGKARLTVRHTAAAPAVDILADGTAAFPNLTNPNEVKADLATGTIQAAVALAGTTDPVIGPAALSLTEGTNTIVYAYGSATDDTLALAVQTISGLHSSPAGVPSGEVGLADDGLPLGIGLVALAGLAIAGFSVARARAKA